MVSKEQRKRALDDIRENIARSGQHIYMVIGETTPRFAYTIGVSESAGVELILAGSIFYMRDDVEKIILKTVAHLKASRDRKVAEVAGLGSFTLREVDSSWAKELMLGVFDYYRKKDIPALQIVPDRDHWTIDVPNMSVPRSASQEPVWKWLREPWAYPIRQDSTAITNLAALRGDESRKPAAGKKTSGNSSLVQDPRSQKRKCVSLVLERFWLSIRHWSRS